MAPWIAASFTGSAPRSSIARSAATTGGDALVSVYGKKLGTDPEHFRHARYIIAWGANIHGNNVHLWPFVEEARHQGARLVVIDPYPHPHRRGPQTGTSPSSPAPTRR